MPVAADHVAWRCSLSSNESRTAKPVFIPKLTTGDIFRAEGDEHEAPLGRIEPTLMALASAARAGEQLNVYGPGGPPAMHEAAQAFGAAPQVTVNVTAGSTPQWADKAKGAADVIFSGAENMMSDFSRTLPGLFDLREAHPLYLPPAVRCPSA